MEDARDAEVAEALEVQIPDTLLRGKCPGIDFMKVKQWEQLSVWVDTNLASPQMFMPTRDDQTPPRNNILMAVSFYGGPLDVVCPFHTRATAAIVSAFRDAGLIDIKGGKTMIPPWGKERLLATTSTARNC